MIRTIEEQLSALLDGELPAAEEELLLRRLERDPSHRATLARYGLIGEVMRGPGLSLPAAFLGERVRSALGAEAAHAASASRREWLGRGLLAAGIAATVAVVAVLTLDPRTASQPEGASAAARVAAASSPAAPLAYGDARYARRDVRSQTVILAPARLTGYLVSHGEYANRLGRQVMDSHIINQTPNVLAASYSPGITDD